MSHGHGPGLDGRGGTAPGVVPTPMGGIPVTIAPRPGSRPPPSTVMTDPAGPVFEPPVVPMPGVAPHRDASDSVQGSIEMGTDGGFVAGQYTPTDIGEVSPSGRSMTGPVFGVLIAVVALLGVGVALWAIDPAPDEPPAPAEPPADVAEPAEPSPVLEHGLRALALVNVRDPARVLPYARRHELLEQLRAGPDAARIDRKLNIALDLRQAADSPSPCETYARALAEVESGPDAYYGDVLEQTQAPERCVHLDTQRQALLALLRPQPEPEPEPEPRKRPRGKGKRGASSVSGEASRPTPSEPKPSKPKPSKPKSTVGGKLDDGLKAFGK